MNQVIKIEKICGACRLLKPDVAFAPNRNACKNCRAELDKARRSARKLNSQCVTCGKSPLVTETRCGACNSKHLEATKKTIKRRELEHKCIKCDEPLRDWRRLACTNCSLDHSEWQAENAQKTKQIVIQNYGGLCACCPEVNLRFLTIDHINGGGNEHRKSLGINGGGHSFYRWLIRNEFPDGFQVMCWNCNIGRFQNGGICPHKEIDLSEEFDEVGFCD